MSDQTQTKHHDAAGDPRGATKFVDRTMSWDRVQEAIHGVLQADAVWSQHVSFPPPHVSADRMKAITPPYENK